MWPGDIDRLEALQRRLAGAEPEPWVPPDRPVVAGCFVCFGRGSSGAGAAGDRGWAAAAIVAAGRVAGTAITAGVAGGPYLPGYLALREGPLLEASVLALNRSPDVLLVNATGRDHPRRAGLAFHLGAALGIPTIGVTHRPLLASGPAPPPERGARSDLFVGPDRVGCWLRTRSGVRALAVHAAWRCTVEVAVEILLGLPSEARTPAPLREARRLARRARASDLR